MATSKKKTSVKRKSKTSTGKSSARRNNPAFPPSYWDSVDGKYKGKRRNYKD